MDESIWKQSLHFPPKHSQEQENLPTVASACIQVLLRHNYQH